VTQIPEELLEAAERNIIRANGAEVVASDENWPPTVAHYREMCAKYPNSVNDSSLIHDAFRNARAALEVVASDLAALSSERQRAERAEAERDSVKRASHWLHSDLGKALIAVEARLKEAEELLKPFAALRADGWGSALPDDRVLAVWWADDPDDPDRKKRPHITNGHLRAAARFLKRLAVPTDGAGG
jgi:hypothetical protein